MILKRYLLLLFLFPVVGLAQSYFHWEKPENQISYTPLTTHYFLGDLAVSHLTSVNYGRIEAGFFINSYRDPTIALC